MRLNRLIVAFALFATSCARPEVKAGAPLLNGYTINRLSNDTYVVKANEVGRVESSGPVNKVAWNNHWIFIREKDGWVIIDTEKGTFVGDMLSDFEFSDEYPKVQALPSAQAYAQLTKPK